MTPRPLNTITAPWKCTWGELLACSRAPPTFVPAWGRADPCSACSTAYNYVLQQLSFHKIRKVSERRIFARNYLLFWFLRPHNRGGCPSTRGLSKNIKDLDIRPLLGYFCLLWAGPAEECCTAVYLPIEDFCQKLPFSLNSLAPK